MNIDEALHILSGPESEGRSEAIERVYSSPGFTKQECEVALERLESWPHYARSSGAIYYILEQSYHSLGFWPSKRTAMRIAESYRSYDLSKKIWSGEEFLVWSCARWHRSKIHGLELPPKAAYIALDIECLQNLTYVKWVLQGLEEFSDISDEVAAAFLLREVFSDDEVSLAKEILESVSPYLAIVPVAIEVIRKGLSPSQITAWLRDFGSHNAPLSAKYRDILIQ